MIDIGRAVYQCPTAPARIRRRGALALLGAAVALLCGAAPDTTTKPPGAVLFSDSFGADTLSSAWTVDRANVWSLKGGHLRAELPDERQKRSFAFAGSERWRDVTVEFDVCGVRGVDKGAAVRVAGATSGVGVDLRAGSYNDVLLYHSFESWGRATAPNANGAWHHVRVDVRGNRYRVFVDGRQRIDVLDPANACPKGRIALAAYTGGVGECVVLYDNVVVRAAK